MKKGRKKGKNDSEERLLTNTEPNENHLFFETDFRQGRAPTLSANRKWL